MALDGCMACAHGISVQLYSCITCQLGGVCVLQILVGNKSDMADEKRAVPYAKGKALADEYNIRFFETSAKDNINVEDVSLQGC